MTRNLPNFQDRSGTEASHLHTPKPIEPSSHSQPAQSILFYRALTLLGFVTLVVTTLVIPAVLEHRVQRVIGFRASDLSASGIRYSAVAQQHCQAQVRQLKPGDWTINIDYADRSEIVRDTPVRNQTELLKQCQDEFKADLSQSKLGIKQGTSPHLLLDQILTMIRSKRTQGMSIPIVVTVWLQAAEPVPGQLQFDPTHLKLQIQQITDARGVVALMGTTGQLQTDLRVALVDNPYVRVCTLNDISECVDWAYKTGRQLPPSQ